MLLLLLFFPGGLSELGINLRDAYLRRVAIKKGIHVPSLLADSLQPVDEREEDEELFEEIAADERELAGTGERR
jgi:hypothetical protein